MKHCILVKFKDTVTDKDALCREIGTFFAAAGEIPGVHGAELRRCVIDRPNRYDLLIRLDMDKAALPNFDASALHLGWKARYTPFLESKAIFDYEE